jgi:hypothetical protein
VKVIFLDVDGVLNHRGSFAPGMPGGSKRIAPECVAQLNHIVAITGASIVVSSTWRMDPDYIEVLRAAGVRGRILGKTPNGIHDIKGGLLVGTCRGDEIQEWITANEPDAFVILDDDSDMAHLLPHLVHTSFDAGLTKEHADEAIERLSTPDKPEGAK